MQLSYAQLYMYMQTHKHTNMHTYIHACICHLYIYPYTHVYMDAYIHTYICTYVHIHACMFTYMHIFWEKIVFLITFQYCIVSIFEGFLNSDILKKPSSLKIILFDSFSTKIEYVIAPSRHRYLQRLEACIELHMLVINLLILGM